jgi:hypothetical protein
LHQDTPDLDQSFATTLRRSDKIVDKDVYDAEASLVCRKKGIGVGHCSAGFDWSKW